MRYLIESGADVNTQLHTGATPVVIAAQKVVYSDCFFLNKQGFKGIVQYLLDECEEVDTRRAGAAKLNALHLATLGGHG